MYTWCGAILDSKFEFGMRCFGSFSFWDTFLLGLWVWIPFCFTDSYFFISFWIWDIGRELFRLLLCRVSLQFLGIPFFTFCDTFAFGSGIQRASLLCCTVPSSGRGYSCCLRMYFSPFFGACVFRSGFLPGIPFSFLFLVMLVLLGLGYRRILDLLYYTFFGERL
jgi:hypothetical protein